MLCALGVILEMYGHDDIMFRIRHSDWQSIYQKPCTSEECYYLAHSTKTGFMFIIFLWRPDRLLPAPRLKCSDTFYSFVILWYRNDLSLAKITRHVEGFSLPVFHGRGIILRLNYSCFYINVPLQARQLADAILSSGPLMKMTKDLCQNQSWIPLFAPFIALTMAHCLPLFLSPTPL